MRGRDRKSARLASIVVAVAGLSAMLAPAAGAKVPVKFKVMAGYPSPGTPANLNVVGVLKTGDPKAKNVLVLNPGTSASAAYFEPLAKTIVKRLRTGRSGPSSAARTSWRTSPSSTSTSRARSARPPSSITTSGRSARRARIRPVPDSAVPFARDWGMNTEINDLRVVVKAAGRRGRNVAMGGHSLGGSITTAYATWDFNGRPGGRDLSGLVLIDGASSPTPVSADQAQTSLNNLQTSSPWLAFGGIPAPFAGLFGTVGSSLTKADPNSPSILATWPLLPANLKGPPGVNPTNEAAFGFATDVKTSPSSLLAAQVHSGQFAASGDPRGWDRAGNITPIQRWASMFSGWGLQNLDGTAWYHPLRLTIDSGAVGDGLPNPAQAVLDVHSTDATKLRKSLRIYAFAAALGNTRVIQGAQALAAEARIPKRNLKLVNRAATYAHNDPSAADPKVNAFLKRLIPFLNTTTKKKTGKKKG